MTPIPDLIIAEPNRTFTAAMLARVCLFSLTALISTVTGEKAASDQLVACMNGTARWKSADGVEVGCMPAVTFDTRKKGGVK